ncbi:LolA-related protein [Agrilutibacter solisilvae]|uniref:Fatty acyl CoA synthetase n=1 Tax=Agrilutibacter solisilvae TaxID=2763317 RepID=A0A974Y0R2_9GAMM|nr:LolA-related protein [Lysobacter solisilvae]QSX79301.1 fatty acyl CoA synthetase [Lysobacter solisilvae]
MTRPLLRMLPATLLLAVGFLQAAPPESAHARAETTTAAADASWILARLARPAPMRTAFVELRGSRLLKKPLRLQGEYRRPDADTLVREVTAPYPETTVIRAGEVVITRDARAPRRFSLARAPELAGLQASFGALLAGDRVALERTYRLATDGTRARWTMTLTPRDAALAARLQSVTLYGRGAELRCIETQPTRGETQRTLLAGAAETARNVTAAGALATLCYGGAKPQ